MMEMTDIDPICGLHFSCGLHISCMHIVLFMKYTHREII